MQITKDSIRRDIYTFDGLFGVSKPRMAEQNTAVKKLISYWSDATIVTIICQGFRTILICGVQYQPDNKPKHYHQKRVVFKLLIANGMFQIIFMNEMFSIAYVIAQKIGVEWRSYFQTHLPDIVSQS